MGDGPTVRRLEGLGGREGGTVTEILLEEPSDTVEPDIAEYGLDGTKELGKDA